MPKDNDNTPKLIPTPQRQPLRPGTIIGDRGEVRPPARSPRQDDAPAELGVPQDFLIGHEVNTGVHALPEDELLSRAKRIQHVTEGTLTQSLESGVRTLRTERVVGLMKHDVETLKTQVKTVSDGQIKLEKAQAEHAGAITGLATKVEERFNAQDLYLAPLVQLATSNALTGHAVIKAQVEVGAAQETAQIEVGAAQKIDVIDEKRDARERRQKILTILSALVALLLGALRLHGCLTE